MLAVTPKSVKDKVQITDDDLTAAFDKDKDRLGTPERRRVQQIAFPDKAAASTRRIKKFSRAPAFVDLAEAQDVDENNWEPWYVEAERHGGCGDRRCSIRTRKGQSERARHGGTWQNCAAARHRNPAGQDRHLRGSETELENKLLKDRAQGAIFDLHDRIEDERAAGTQLSEIADKFKLSYQVFDQVDRKGKTPDGKVVDLQKTTC